MAMLAEPRRKQKWSVDPRNSAWSKDDSKFGQKMLEKFGWSKGKGLGAQEQGSTEHVKVQLKNNTLGLGASVKHEDNWIAHQDDFNQLLADLNNCHGAADSDPPAEDNKKSFSLEEKSKSSKKRVHYMKFAKGKDLSCRSDTDLACIFGKREKSKKSNEEDADEDSEGSEEKEKESPSPTNDVEMGNTVTSTLSVSEYFAKRMAELKKSRSKNAEDTLTNMEASPEDGTDSSSEEPKRKRKKNKHNKTSTDCPEEHELVENNNEEDHSVSKKKKSKSKKAKKIIHTENDDNAEEQEGEQEEEQAQEEKRKKKKKSKRTKEVLDINESNNDDFSPNEDIHSEEPKKKKKKKKRTSDD